MRYTQPLVSPRSLGVALLAGVLVLALDACATLTVTSDVNRELIGRVHCGTFAWAGSFQGGSALRNTIANPINETRLRAAITAHLQATGIHPVDANADCLVGYGIGTRYVVWGGSPGWGWGWGGPWGPGWSGPYVSRESLIAIDLFDARSRQPLWHATVDANLWGLSGDKAEQRISEAVSALFAKYPG